MSPGSRERHLRAHQERLSKYAAASGKGKKRPRTKSEAEALHRETVSILHKAMAVLQLATVAQFGCGAKERFSSNTLKQTQKGNHYG